MFNFYKIINFSGRTFKTIVTRNYSARKRFYKSSSVIHAGNGKFEVTLDQRKLKTPSGSQFIVGSEPLAIAVATEWNNQKGIINQSTMHLTSLCNTAIDNPNHLTKTDMVNYILNYLPTDTVLFHSNDSGDLYDLQSNVWDPVIKWFNDEYKTDVTKTRDFVSPTISAETRMNISKYLSSYDEITIHGFVYAVDVLKSVILALACINRRITVEEAVSLSRLEEEYQLKFWGRVEWHHDLSQQDSQARLSAAVLFIYFNSTNAVVKEKLVL